MYSRCRPCSKQILTRWESRRAWIFRTKCKWKSIWISVAHFAWIQECEPHGGARGKVRGPTQVIWIHHLGTTNICTKSLDNPSNSCWNISVWTPRGGPTLPFLEAKTLRRHWFIVITQSWEVRSSVNWVDMMCRLRVLPAIRIHLLCNALYCCQEWHAGQRDVYTGIRMCAQFVK